MAQQLDLQEQEQLEQLKAFWAQYGNAITWLLTLVLLAYAGWNGYQYWQRQQAAQAAALYDEVERQAQTGDMAKTLRSFEEMKNRFPATLCAQQAALLVARTAVQAKAPQDALGVLEWLGTQGKDSAYASVARLRHAALLLEQKQHDAALAVLATAPADAEFAPLFAQRRGDVLLAKGSKEQAGQAYLQAYKESAAENTEQRQMLEIKLNALGLSGKADEDKGAAK
ncbi:MAG: tetratricopeptide repeat protein [Rhodoferax sp.]